MNTCQLSHCSNHPDARRDLACFNCELITLRELLISLKTAMRLLNCIFCLSLYFSSVAQITPRNLLQKNCSPGKLKQVLITQNKFHPFPASPEQWKNALPDSMLRLLIKNGESALKEDFPVLPATVTLDFVRNGDRIRYENI